MHILTIENGIRALSDEEVEMVAGGRRVACEAIKELFKAIAVDTTMQWIRNGGIGRFRSSVYNGTLSVGGHVVSGLVRAQQWDFPENP